MEELQRASALDPSSKIRRNTRVVARQLAEHQGAVLLHLDTGAYHRVNQVGLMVWELLDSERTVDQLVEGVRDQVTNAPPEIGQDITNFLERAVDRDLIQIAD